MKTIPLTQGKFAIVDDADYEWLMQWKWFAQKDKNAFYACRRSKMVKGKQKKISMHVEIIGKKEGLITDHINGNGLDNRRENLRHVTYRQNAQNRHNERSSKLPGVCWDKRRNKWKAQICLKGKQTYLGRFTGEEEAFKAYWAAVVDTMSREAVR